jgi:hypothetical protein
MSAIEQSLFRNPLFDCSAFFWEQALMVAEDQPIVLVTLYENIHLNKKNHRKEGF